MNTKQFEALADWIESLIAVSLDNQESADGGLTLYSIEIQQRCKAFKALVDEEAES